MEKPFQAPKDSAKEKPKPKRKRKKASKDWRLCLPRPCRFLVCRGSADAGQITIGESLAAYVAHSRIKPGLIVSAAAPRLVQLAAKFSF
jgi:hypothetical protein